MKRLPLLLFLLPHFTASAQHSLSQSRRTSVHDYLYELNNDETLQIHAYGIDKVNSSFLHTLKDSFPHGNKIPEHIPPGNYLKVYAENDKLQTIFTPIPTAYPRLLNNARDLIVILHDKKGNLIENAELRIGKYIVPYDTGASSWRLERYEKGGILEVYHKGVLNCAILRKSAPARIKRFWPGILHGAHPGIFPRRKKHQPARWRRSEDDYSPSAYERRYLGYMVSNKPKYKPGDTIKLKAFISDKQGIPVNKPLILRLSDRHFVTDTILSTLIPYSPGAYTYEFACTRGMNLDLDKNYRVTLETTDSRKYDLDTYEGDLDDEEYMAQRKVLVRTEFSLEEYELHALSFKARTEKTKSNNSEQIAVYCQAKDENELPVMDGTIQLSITTHEILKYYESDIFIPDTLWRYSGPMDAIGETKILLPDSIFPKADFTYNIDCIFTNSNNERQMSALRRYHYYKGTPLSFDLKSDSLYITLGDSAKHEQTNVYGLNRNSDTIETFSIMLPTAIKINPFIARYAFKSDNIEDEYAFIEEDELFDDEKPINYDISWSNDTTTVKIENPQKLFFWHYIFEHSKIISRGYGNSLTWSGATGHKEQYELRICYMWGGKIREQFVSFSDPGYPLVVSLVAPPNIYPGQTTALTVNVRDKYQRPVAAADVTTYAYTSKFTHEDDPVVSFYQPAFWKRKPYHTPTVRSMGDLTSKLTLDWKQYKSKMGLDSLLFFRFTHPSPYFIHTEPSIDAITQIAPFVFSGGSIQPVHIVSVDEIPVYCSFTNPLQPYSIRVAPGYHWISLRTLHQRLSFNLTVSEGVKTFISIDSAIKWPDMRVETMPSELTETELRQINKYMLYVRNTVGDRPAYITQHGQLHWLNGPARNKVGYRSNYIVGPLAGTTASLIVKDHVMQDFTPEPGYAFEITQGLIKQKQIDDLSQRFKYLRLNDTDTSLSAVAWSQKMADSLSYQQQLNNLRERDLLNEEYSSGNKNRLIIDLSHSGISSSSEILQYVFFRGDDPSFARSYRGSTNSFPGMETGYYKLLVLLTGQRYFIKDSVLFKANALHYYKAGHVNILPADSSSTNLEKRLLKIATGSSNHASQERIEIAEDFNNSNFNNANLTRTVYGLVVNSKGDPIPWASVILRGTPVGCKADARGRFQLRTTGKGFLKISSIGHQTMEHRLTNDDFYTITLFDVTTQLKETVIIAYFTTTKRYNVGNIVTIKTETPSMPDALFQPIICRNSLPNTTDRLIIVNGVPFTGKLSDLPPDAIKSLDILTDADAIAIYGSRGAHGVVLVTTKPRNQTGKDDHPEPSVINSLRTNFRDDAFWQPRLKTDVNGNASFKVTFPDDITSWNTFAFAIAMADKKQAGMRKIQIRAFKALSGTLALPLFAVEGDSIHIISKALNYTPDSIKVVHTFTMNDSIHRTGSTAFKNAFIDTIPVFINGSDSVSFKYTLNKDGYMDGEQRKIPLIARGSGEITGFFTALYNDTSFTYMPKCNEPVIIRTESAMLPVLLDEMIQVQQYKYLCNEQLASKLKAYLLEKKVYSYLKKDFKKESGIKDILKQLDQRKKDGLWGWWENSPVSLWTSRHVIEALLMADEQGYKTYFNKQIAIDHFTYELTSGRESDRIGCLELLAHLGAKINYSPYIDSILARSGNGGYDTIKLAMLQQESGQPLNLSPILSRQKNTAFGNAYWGSESYDLFDNSIQRTLQVYKLLRKTGGYEPVLQKIRGYFLEQRKDGHWRNTYESSLILETILPDILEDESNGPVSLSINGRAVSQFPYTDTLTQAGKISVSKQGKRPVYFTAYQQYVNREPEKISGLFTVSSAFGDNGMVQQELKAGVPVTLKVEVTAQKTADYVLVEIPIPAGCSYNSKSQSWASQEVHREHFKDRVSIFCSQLTAGKHTFYVSLLPRYSGRYYLNPAKAEMQYFPIFMGREALKKVYIQ